MPTGQNNRKILGLNSPGTATSLGGDDYDILTLWHENTDLTAGAYAGTPFKSTVNTPTEFRDNKLRFLNPLQTKSLRIRTLGFTGDYDLTLPLVDASDTFLFIDHDAQIYNKTISVNDNPIIATGISSGDLLKSNGTRFLLLPRGLPDQVLTVTDDGLDLEWADLPAAPAGGGGIPDDNSVTTAKIVDSAVTDAKLAGSITGGKILDGAITTAKIADLGVTAAKIANTTITGGKLANATITGTQIASNTILGTNMVNSTVSTTQLADNAVTTAKIADGQVTSAKLASAVGGAPFMTMETWGQAMGRNATTGGAIGLLDPITMIATHTGTLSPNGVYIQVPTGTSSNTLVGERSTNQITRRQLNPTFFARFMLSATDNVRMFAGLISSSTITSSGDNFLDSLEGVGVMLRNNGTEFRMVRNDGSATDTETSSGWPAPVAAPIAVRIELNDTPSCTTKLWADTTNGDSTLTPTITNTTTTTLPASTTSLYYAIVISNSTTADKTLYRWIVQLKNKW